MRRILLDTNILLDVLLDRKAHAEASAAIWAAVEAGSCEGMIAAHAVTTIHYLVGKELGHLKASRIISSLLRVFKVASVDAAILQEALQLPQSDFEDAVTAAAARAARCEFIVTRDPKGFNKSPVRCLTPEAVRPLLYQ
jgi:predicted nucleic acid-binding protein